jgi:hypothetical protein
MKQSFRRSLPSRASRRARRCSPLGEPARAAAVVVPVSGTAGAMTPGEPRPSRPRWSRTSSRRASVIASVHVNGTGHGASSAASVLQVPARPSSSGRSEQGLIQVCRATDAPIPSGTRYLYHRRRLASNRLRSRSGAAHRVLARRRRPLARPMQRATTVRRCVASAVRLTRDVLDVRFCDPADRQHQPPRPRQMLRSA